MVTTKNEYWICFGFHSKKKLILKKVGKSFNVCISIRHKQVKNMLQNVCMGAGQ